MEASQRAAGGRDNRERRRRRVKRMKTAIILILITLLLVPTVCCIVLFAKMSHMQKQLNSLLAIHEEGLSEGKAGGGEVQTVAQAAQLPGPEATEPADTATDEVKKDREAVETPRPREETEDAPAEYADDLIEGKKVYLTFDDGPSSHTDKILDVLGEYNIKATFFVIGKTDQASREAYRRIVAEGHTLGMHSYSHRYKTMYRSVKAFQEDFQKLRDLLYEETGIQAQFYRFPGGSSNTVSGVDVKKLISWFNRSGISYFDWNAATGDALGKELTVSQMVRNVKEDVERFDSSVVLMHDTAAKETTLTALPAIIQALKKENAVFLPITENTRPVQHLKADSAK